jgi:hypothetical protein
VRSLAGNTLYKPIDKIQFTAWHLLSAVKQLPKNIFLDDLALQKYYIHPPETVKEY